MLAGLLRGKKCAWSWYLKWNLKWSKIASKGCVWRGKDLVFLDKVTVVGAQQKGGQEMPWGNDVGKQEGAIPYITL